MSKIDIFDKTQRKLSIKEVADLLDRSPRTVRTWIQRGLEAAKIGGEWFTTRDAVMEFVKRSTEDGQADQST
jgi:excisionase family DNA binding protein